MNRGKNLEKSVVHLDLGPRDVGRFELTADEVVANPALLQKLGIQFGSDALQSMMSYYGSGMDSNNVGISPPPLSNLTTPTITNPVQFFQAWLPGAVPVLTWPLKIEQLLGIMTVGSFEDEQVVQEIVEGQGVAVPYSDRGNLPLTDWNQNFEVRSVVRYMLGFHVGTLEEMRAARMRIQASAAKRGAVIHALNIEINRVGFYGYNDGSGATYGMLNEPGLGGYNNVPNGEGGDPEWSTKSFLEITADIRDAIAGLQAQSLGWVDPKETDITMAIPISVEQYLSVNAVGTGFLSSQTVGEWLQHNFPKVRVVTAPELEDANGGARAAYFYAESFGNTGTDDGKVWAHVVPTKLMNLGMEKEVKGYSEGSANATAGAMCKRPLGVWRISGI